MNVLRATEWWAPKLAPALGAGYLTALYAHVTVLDVAGNLLVALVALAFGAVFVSVVNDLTDLESDARACKANRLAGRGRRGPLALALASAGLGTLVVTLAAARDPAVVLLYIGGYVAFTAYSVPPLRLKGRGLPGALADAAGAVAVPFAFVAAVVLSAAGQPVSWWLVGVGLWGLAGGLRGATWHQLGDVEADVASGTATWALRAPRAAWRLAVAVALPIELTALVVLLAAAGAWLAFPAFVLYGAIELGRRWAWGVPIVAVRPVRAPVAARVGYRLLLQDFYVVVLPVAVLVQAASRAPSDAVVLALQLACFPVSTIIFGRDVVRLAVVIAARPERARLGVSVRRRLGMRELG